MTGHALRLALFILLGALVRVGLYADFPAFLTLDSPDYVIASVDIARSADFRGPALGDWRLPAYPVFLALLRPFTGTDLQRVVLAQALLGMVSLLLGLGIGRLLGSRTLCEVLVLLLGLGPVQLLNEHLLMAESLFSLTLLGFSALVLVCLRGAVSGVTGLGLGAVFGICVLTRSNGLFFCLPLLGGMLFLRRRDPAAGLRRFALGFLLAALAIGGPWVWRNYALLGSITPLTRNFHRNLLIYQSQHGLLDRSLPAMRRWGRSYDPERPDSIYRVIIDLGPDTDDAERRASAIRREQLADHPGRYLEEIAFSFAGFGGYLGRHPGRSDVRLWFERIVGNVHRLDGVNASLMGDLAPLGFRVDRASGNTVLTRAWSRVGHFYLGKLRWALFSIFLVCVLAGRPWRSDATAALFAAAYGATIAFHSVTLSDYDRFAAPFDWVLVLVIVRIAPGAIERCKRTVARAAASASAATLAGRRSTISHPDVEVEGKPYEGPVERAFSYTSD